MKAYIGPYRKGTDSRTVRVRVDGSDLWNLDCTLAEVIVPLLKAFRQGSWNRSLDADIGEMIWAFEQVRDGKHIRMDVDLKRVRRGLRLFAERYMRLWV